MLQNCKDFGEKKTLAAHQDGKLNRFYKLAIALCVLFIATKSPVEISSFIDLIHTNQLFAIVNKRPDELGQHRHTYFEKTKHFLKAITKEKLKTRYLLFLIPPPYFSLHSQHNQTCIEKTSECRARNPVHLGRLDAGRGQPHHIPLLCHGVQVFFCNL